MVAASGWLQGAGVGEVELHHGGSLGVAAVDVYRGDQTEKDVVVAAGAITEHFDAFAHTSIARGLLTRD